MSAMNFLAAMPKAVSISAVSRLTHFNFDAKTRSYRFTPEGKPATAFLLI
jgi:hypothetical protein